MSYNIRKFYSSVIYVDYHFSIAAGDILGKLDETANPCNDMVRFSCGKWLDESEMPGSKSRWGNFDVLNSLIESVLHSMLYNI